MTADYGKMTEDYRKVTQDYRNMTEDYGKMTEYYGKLRARARAGWKWPRARGARAARNPCARARAPPPEDYGKKTQDYGKIAEDYGKLTEDYGRLREADGKMTEDYGKMMEDYGTRAAQAHARAHGGKCVRARARGKSRQVLLPHTANPGQESAGRHAGRICWRHTANRRVRGGARARGCSTLPILARKGKVDC